MSKKEVGNKGTMELKQVISYLEDLTSSLKTGSICVQSGGEFVTLKPLGPVDLEIEATQKKGKESLVLELGWKTELPTAGEPVNLKITSKEPEPVPSVEAEVLKVGADSHKGSAQAKGAKV